VPKAAWQCRYSYGAEVSPIDSVLLPMALDYITFNLLRQNHPAWRLLRAQHAPLVAGFLHRVFIVPNVRILSQADLVEALEDELFALRQQQGAELFPVRRKTI